MRANKEYAGVSKKEATKNKAASADEERAEADVTRAVLLTREREDGIETSVEDVTIQRAIMPYGRRVDATVDEIVDTLEHNRGVSAEELTTILYEDNDEAFRVVNDGRRKTKRCQIGYRVAVTLGDTGLGQSETLFKLFKDKDEAEKFADEIGAYDAISFQRDNDEPQLVGQWEGRYKDAPEVIESSFDIGSSVDEARDGILTTGTILTLCSLFLGVLAYNIDITAAILITLLLQVVMLPALFGFGSSMYGYLQTRTARSITTLERDTDAICTAQQLRTRVDPATLETHVGVSVERTDGEIRVTQESINAEWAIELEDGVIADEDAASLLQSADLHELEQGRANLVVQQNADGRAVSAEQPDLQLESTDGKWLLLPRDVAQRYR